MDKKTWIIIGVLVIGVGTLLGISIAQGKAARADYSNYDHHSIVAADENTGGFAENIEGSADAPVIIYEYGDYQCTACAPANPYINSLLEEYGDKVALVFRTTIMSYHQNGTAAASAANAVAKQGYWKAYKDLLFANQNDWYYSEADQRQTQFEEYFMKVSGGKGDLAKFREDMASSDVQKKINFDEAMADKAGVQFTPYFLVEDTWVDQREIPMEEFLNKMRAEIDKRLEEKGIKVEKKKSSK